MHRLDKEGLLLKQAHGPILECGCGTGRILLPLARAGFTVTGLDNSSAMLDIARQKLTQETPEIQARVTLVQGEMTQIELNGRYTLIIIPYNTLLHLTPAQVNQTLANLRQLLGTDGRLFIDIVNPFAMAQMPDDRMITLEQTFTDPHTGHTVLQFASSWPDNEAQILHITWIYDVTPANGGPIHRTISQFTYHYLYPHELELQLRQSGFQLEALWGDYNRSPFDEESDRLLVIAHV